MEAYIPEISELKYITKVVNRVIEDTDGLKDTILTIIACMYERAAKGEAWIEIMINEEYGKDIIAYFRKEKYRVCKSKAHNGLADIRISWGR